MSLQRLNPKALNQPMEGNTKGTTAGLMKNLYPIFLDLAK